MSRRTWWVQGLVLMGWGLCAGIVWGQAVTVTEDGVIQGMLDIDFQSRLDPNAQDTYTFKLRVAQTTEYAGKISRRGLAGELAFNVTLAVMNPRNVAEKKIVGKWVGTVPSGATPRVYEVGGGGAGRSPLRMHIDTVGAQPAMVNSFAGEILDRSRNVARLAAQVYMRPAGGMVIAHKVDKTDPLRFKDVELAKGPAASYPHTAVSGQLDYAVDAGHWLTKGITFKYTVADKEVEDVMTGSLRWNPDVNRLVNGQGQYEFNLRFNEAKAMPAAVAGMLPPEDAYFRVDESIPCLIGKTSYVETFIPGTSRVAKSKVTVALNANKLTKAQAVNFFKLWLLSIVPLHDE